MASICDLNDKKPDISYPVFWEYKVIFENDIDAQKLISEIVLDRKHKITFSKFSKDKKYKSYSVNVFVLNESERLEIFSALKHIAKYVL